MELLVILAYAGLLALVASFVLPKTEFYGKLVPFSISLTAGSVLWLILTWIGLSYQSAWIWFAVMLGMPLAGWFGSTYLSAKREQAEKSELQSLRLSGKA